MFQPFFLADNVRQHGDVPVVLAVVVGVHGRAVAPQTTPPRACVFVLTFAAIQLVDAALWYCLHVDAARANGVLSRYAIPTVLAGELAVAHARTYGGWRCFAASCVVQMYAAWWYSCDRPTIAGDSGFLDWCQYDARYGGLGDLRAWAFFGTMLWPIALAFPTGGARDILVVLLAVTFGFSVGKPQFGARAVWEDMYHAG